MGRLVRYQMRVFLLGRSLIKNNESVLSLENEKVGYCNWCYINRESGLVLCCVRVFVLLIVPGHGQGEGMEDLSGGYHVCW